MFKNFCQNAFISLYFIVSALGGFSARLEFRSFSPLKTLKILQLKTNKELNIDNENNLVFQHFGYAYDVPDIATVNKAIKVMLKELQISPLITTKGARHTYGSYLWHNNIDLGVIAKILGHKDISMLVDVYGHTLQEKISEEFMAVKSLL
ncbi:integrase [Streptococcus pneumoniae]|nr:integrase [Streptococcus pneumoniae]VJV18113.1 integrase [Streptococcus pneumoniae]VOT45772.1 integrase [Streptococcus pneumoniae]VQU15221.1 integrase [Streptococcus pneumoniae]